jgi:hypothetical protein
MRSFGSGLVLLAAYLLLVILARWAYIARTNAVWSRAQSEAMGKRLSVQAASLPADNGETAMSQRMLQELIHGITGESQRQRSTEAFGWSGAQQIEKWVLIHEAERLALRALGHEQLVARLERARGQLAELPRRRREEWEVVIDSLLASREEAEDERRNRRYRAYLDELLGEVYEASNGKATQLSGLYNRATWVILVALLPLVVLSGLGYGLILITGAIGGIVSRMQRLVFSRRIAITYGSSWGPLFCAPVLGALAAWTGLVLISLLQTAGVLQLTALQTSLADLQSPSSALLGVAILLGMSERFLLKLEQQAEAVIDPETHRRSDQSEPANPAATLQRRRPSRPQPAVAAPTMTDADAA